MAATFPPEVCENFRPSAGLSREWTVDRCSTLAESWRPARPKPIGDPAWAGRTTHCCTKCLGRSRRWGFALPPRDKVHSFARLKFIYATHPDLKRIGLALEPLGRLRNAARLPNRDLGTVRVGEDCRFRLERRRISRNAARRNRG